MRRFKVFQSFVHYMNEGTLVAEFDTREEANQYIDDNEDYEAEFDSVLTIQEDDDE